MELPRPWLPAWLFPVGTVLMRRNGRKFKVTSKRYKSWYDPSLGRGGGHWVWKTSRRYWKEIGL